MKGLYSLLVLMVVIISETRAVDIAHTNLTSDSGTVIMMHGTFKSPLQYSGEATELEAYIKGGDVKTIYCEGNTRPLVSQSRKGETNTDEFTLWVISLETNHDTVTKMLNSHAIHCNVINQLSEEQVEAIPFRVVYPLMAEDIVISPVYDRNSELTEIIDELIHDGEDRSFTILMSGVMGVIISIVVPVLVIVINRRRIRN